MKKLILAGAIFALLSCAPGSKTKASTSIPTEDDEVAMQSQQRPAPNDSVRKGRRGGKGDRNRKKMDPSRMAEMRTKMMVKRYDLSDKQKSQLLELNKQSMEQMGQKQQGEQRPDFRNMTDEKREAMQKEREAKEAKYDAALKKIFTSKQYKAYTKDKKNRQERFEGGPDEMGPGRGEGPDGGGPGNGGPGDDGGFGGGGDF